MDLLSAFGGNLFTVVTYAVAFFFVLCLVIFIHELGHFWAGRACGVRVVSFSIGFGPEVFGFTDRHGTRWKISAIPLGGYVRFFGDLHAASTPDHEGAAAMSAAERAVSFPHKPVGQRAFIVAAGPLANFLLAIALYAGLAGVQGRVIFDPVVATVEPGSPADRAGIVPGDRFIAIDGAPIRVFEDVQRIVQPKAGETLQVLMERGGRTVQLEVVPELRELRTRFGVVRHGVLGLRTSTDASNRRVETFTPIEAIVYGVRETGFVIERTLTYLGRLIIGRESVDQLSGPARIAQVSGEVAMNSGVLGLLSLAALLSVSIGLINLFPVPMLDGGHLLFYAVEAVRRRPLGPRTQEIGFRLGFALVIALMIVATWNDLMHFVSM